MNSMIKVAAWLAAFTSAIHLFWGTAEVHGPLLNSSLPPEMSLMLYACWHLVSCALIGSAVALFAASRSKQPERWMPAVKTVGLLWLSFGAVFLVVALAFSGPGMMLQLPQWTLLLPVGALALKGGSAQMVSKPLPSQQYPG